MADQAGKLDKNLSEIDDVSAALWSDLNKAMKPTPQASPDNADPDPQTQAQPTTTEVSLEEAEGKLNKALKKIGDLFKANVSSVGADITKDRADVLGGGIPTPKLFDPTNPPPVGPQVDKSIPSDSWDAIEVLKSIDHNEALTGNHLLNVAYEVQEIKKAVTILAKGMASLLLNAKVVNKAMTAGQIGGVSQIDDNHNPMAGVTGAAQWRNQPMRRPEQQQVQGKNIYMNVPWEQALNKAVQAGEIDEDEATGMQNDHIVRPEYIPVVKKYLPPGSQA